MTTAGNDTANTREDELLARVYQQVIGAQAEQYAAAYDAGAGLAWFTGWLQDHAVGDLAADPGVAELYSRHYLRLVQLAVLLVRDVETAEDVVQDAFLAMREGWQRLRDPETAFAYLLQAVVNRSRSVLRHQAIAAKDRQEAPPHHPSAEHEALLLERSAVVAALRGLPERQREAVVLKYYGDLSEDQIAAVMNISRGAVKSHTARGMSVLRAALEQATTQPARPQDSEHEPSNP
jgi:RNA polymerase sigma-70 factor (sigma-E family)